jgi:hypothetical protein
VYNNDTLIVESFLDEPVDVQAVTDERLTALTDLVSGQTVTIGPAIHGLRGRIGGRRFDVALPPHSYRVFKGQQ